MINWYDELKWVVKKLNLYDEEKILEGFQKLSNDSKFNSIHIINFLISTQKFPKDTFLLSLFLKYIDNLENKEIQKELLSDFYTSDVLFKPIAYLNSEISYEFISKPEWIAKGFSAFINDIDLDKKLPIVDSLAKLVFSEDNNIGKCVITLLNSSNNMEFSSLLLDTILSRINTIENFIFLIGGINKDLIQNHFLKFFEIIYDSNYYKPKLDLLEIVLDNKDILEYDEVNILFSDVLDTIDNLKSEDQHLYALIYLLSRVKDSELLKDENFILKIKEQVKEDLILLEFNFPDISTLDQNTSISEAIEPHCALLSSLKGTPFSKDAEILDLAKEQLLDVLTQFDAISQIDREKILTKILTIFKDLNMISTFTESFEKSFLDKDTSTAIIGSLANILISDSLFSFQEKKEIIQAIAELLDNYKNDFDFAAPENDLKYCLAIYKTLYTVGYNQSNLLEDLESSIFKIDTIIGDITGMPYEYLSILCKPIKEIFKELKNSNNSDNVPDLDIFDEMMPE